MTTGNYSIKKIYDDVLPLMASVSNNVFSSERPHSFDAPMTDFVVVAISGSVVGDSTQGTGVIRFGLYAKDNDVYENNVKLNQMLENLYAKLPFSNNNYLIHNPVLIQGGTDQMGFHSWFIQCNLLIKKK